MNILDSVLAAIMVIVGLVIFYVVYDTFSQCLGTSAALLAVVPIALAAGVVIYVLIRSFSLQQ